MAIDIEELEEQVAAAQRAYLAVARTDPAAAEKASAEHKRLKVALARALAEGADPCPSCGGAPTGLHQPTSYEIGCTNCRDHRARGQTRRKAVAAWNAGPAEWVKVPVINESNAALARLLRARGLPPTAILVAANQEA